MRLCAIIPALNEEDSIGELLDSLNADSFRDREIIVVDDGSSDRTVKIAEKKGAKVLVNSPGRKGPSFGWNRAAKETNAEILLFLGADFLIEDKSFIKKAMNAFEDKNVVAVSTKFKTIQDNWLEKALTEREGVSMEPRFVRRKDFLALGGFPLIGFGEDQILVERLAEYCEKKGLRQVTLQDAYFSGHGVHSLKEMYRQGYWYGKTANLYLSLTKKGVRAFFSVYLRVLHFLSIASSPLVFVNPFFAVLLMPFILFFAGIALNSAKRKSIYPALRVFTFVLFGFAMFHGLIFYCSWLDRNRGR